MAGTGVASRLEATCLFGDDVLGVVELLDLLDLGVAYFVVVAFGVAALGVADLGVADLGVVDLGVVALELGVASWVVNATCGLSDSRCGLLGNSGVLALVAGWACLTGVLRSCFSTVGDGSGSCI